MGVIIVGLPGGAAGGYTSHASMSLDPHDFFTNSGGTESDWQLMTSAGYVYDPSKAGAGGWMYKGDPSCAQTFLAPDSSSPNGKYQVAGVTYDKPLDAIKAMAKCNAGKSKNGSGAKNGKNGKCCCCCCKKNGTTQSQSIVFKGATAAQQPDYNQHWGGVR